MTSILDDLFGQLGGQNLSKIARTIGADEGQTGAALGAALPVLLGALSKNASTPEGAQSLNAALERDHDGGVLDDLQGFFGGGDKSADAGILGHIFGKKQQNVENNLSRSSGLDLGMVKKLLPLLAPVVLGYLGRQKRKQNLNSGGLSDILGGERRNMEQRAPKSGGLLGSLLDRDGDGDVDLGDLAAMFRR